MNLTDFTLNKHTADDVDFNLFTLEDYIAATRGPGHPETASNRLGAYLLQMCNTSHKTLKVFPQISAFHVKCGDDSEYDSIPDGGVYIRESTRDSEVVFLVLEDAKLPRPSGPANKEY